MAPKSKSLPPAVAALAAQFEAAGIAGPKAVDAAKSELVGPALRALLERNEAARRPLAPKPATLVLHLASAGAQLAPDQQSVVYGAVTDGRLQSADQVSAAVEYLSDGRPYEPASFDAACGVGASGPCAYQPDRAGVTVPRDQILSAARSAVAENRAEVDSGRYAMLSRIVVAVRARPEMRWAAPLDVKTAVEDVFAETIGPRDDAAALKAKSKAESRSAKAVARAPAPTASTSSLAEAPNMFEVGWLADVARQGEPKQVEPKRLEEHLARTGGKFFSRFPPEPNGFLHIGHSKAIAVNFGFARAHGGHCYLRYDDTNPEAEEQVYFDSILEIVRWLGFEPFRITYSSDYFDQLYALAVELIKRDKAYICHCTAADMQRNRGVRVVDGKEEHGPRIACAHRSRPIAESLAEFERMRQGAYEPGAATLRMKQSLESGSPQMWDLVAYRTLKAPHHRTGTKWRIYPTYDFTHCLVDSFEDITHSLCTTEFILSRESYDWLCDALTVYRPQQYEYGRLNIEGTVTSKRKILKLVREGHVNGWDDPRLYTLIALKRRGVPPGAILGFINQLGVTTSSSTISTLRFEQAIRQYLETTTPRLMVIMRPVRVTIENLPADHHEVFERPVHPKQPELGTMQMTFARTVYIDRSDFRTEDAADYFRLAPGKSVGLLNVPRPITCTSFQTDPATGEVVEILARYDDEGPLVKPKAYIQWVAEHAPSGSPVRIAEARVFKPLFRSANPAGLDDYLADIDRESIEVERGAIVETGFWAMASASMASAREAAEKRADVAAGAERADAPAPTTGQLVGNECVRFQGMRTAYFALDKDAEVDLAAHTGRIVLNTIVALKADAGAKTA